MPLPVPKKGQTKQDYINECVPQVIEEGTTDNPVQAVAICNSIWEKEKKK